MYSVYYTAVMTRRTKESVGTELLVTGERTRARVHDGKTSSRELVPILERLRPRQFKGVTGGVARGVASVSVQTARCREVVDSKKRGRVRGSSTRSVRKRPVRVRGRREAVRVGGVGDGVSGDGEEVEERGGVGSEGEVRESKEEEEKEMAENGTEEGERQSEREIDSPPRPIPKLRRTHAIVTTHSTTTVHTPDHSPPSLSDQDEAKEYEYPQPSSNFQKMQRKLAREKQLENMRARELAYAREERFLRRQGLSKGAERSNDRRCVVWREGNSLVEVFNYSPCSSLSRGSTLDPDDIPDS